MKRRVCELNRLLCDVCELRLTEERSEYESVWNASQTVDLEMSQGGLVSEPLGSVGGAKGGFVEMLPADISR